MNCTCASLHLMVVSHQFTEVAKKFKGTVSRIETEKGSRIYQKQKLITVTKTRLLIYSTSVSVSIRFTVPVNFFGNFCDFTIPCRKNV